METFVLLMSVGGVVMVIFAFIAILSFIMTAKKTHNTFKEGGNFMNSMISGMGLQLVFGFISSLGGIALIVGFIWFLLETFGRHG